MTVLIKPEDKVPSRKLCQDLFRLGITKNVETERVWARCVLDSFDSDRIEWGYNEEYVLHHDLPLWAIEDMREDSEADSYKIIPAPDLSEMRELLPTDIGNDIEPIDYTLNPDNLARLVMTR